MPLNGIEENAVTIDGVHTFYRRVEGEGPPVVFLHGNPTHSEDWLPFLEAIEVPALALDLPGWGSSERPAGFDYSMHGLAAFFERFLDQLGVSEHALVAHDWGALALIGAQRRPERLRRLVLLNAVPLLPGYRWHWVARWFWRVPVAGELFNLAGTKRAAALALRQVSGDGGAMPPEFVDMLWRGYRRGTGRPVLELYRSADPDALAAAGSKLARIECPALVVWGESDRFLPAQFGRLYAERLGDAEYVGVPGAGHWPWIERPEVVDRVLAFLG